MEVFLDIQPHSLKIPFNLKCFALLFDLIIFYLRRFHPKNELEPYLKHSLFLLLSCLLLSSSTPKQSTIPQPFPTNNKGLSAIPGQSLLNSHQMSTIPQQILSTTSSQATSSHQLLTLPNESTSSSQQLPTISQETPSIQEHLPSVSSEIPQESSSNSPSESSAFSPSLKNSTSLEFFVALFSLIDFCLAYERSLLNKILAEMKDIVELGLLHPERELRNVFKINILRFDELLQILIEKNSSSSNSSKNFSKETFLDAEFLLESNYIMKILTNVVKRNDGSLRRDNCEQFFEVLTKLFGNVGIRRSYGVNFEQKGGINLEELGKLLMMKFIGFEGK